MNLIALPAFTDNYIWILHGGANAIVVDPGDSAPVIESLTKQQLALAGILVTHHHDDHVGGLAGLRPLLKGPVYGPAPTLPSSIAQERLINPFLRCGEPAVVQAARRHGASTGTGTDVFAALRQWKNEFR